MEKALSRVLITEISEPHKLLGTFHEQSLYESPSRDAHCIKIENENTKPIGIVYQQMKETVGIQAHNDLLPALLHNRQGTPA